MQQTRYGKEVPDLHRYLIDLLRKAGGGGGLTFTAATVLSGHSYSVKTSDIAIRMDTSGRNDGDRGPARTDLHR